MNINRDSDTILLNIVNLIQDMFSNKQLYRNYFTKDILEEDILGCIERICNIHYTNNYYCKSNLKIFIDQLKSNKKRVHHNWSSFNIDEKCKLFELLKEFYAESLLD